MIHAKNFEYMFKSLKVMYRILWTFFWTKCSTESTMCSKLSCSLLFYFLCVNHCIHLVCCQYDVIFLQNVLQTILLHELSNE